MAALVCQHEFVMVAADLFTEGNFASYDLMLSHVAKEYQQGHGRKLVSLFLGIACQFNSYWNTYLPLTYLHLGCLRSVLHDCMTQSACQPSDLWISPATMS